MTQPEDRECSMTVCVGSQGAGKSYYNMYLIRDYCTDKIYNKVKGRKCLILDSNGEFEESQWIQNDIHNFKSRTIAIKDIPEFASKNHPIECRRIDMKNMLISEKLEVLTFVINNFTNGLLLAEDINSYVLNLTHLENIIGRMVSLRHRGLDVILSFQGLRAINPVIYRNTRWVRYHKQLDDAHTIKDKVTNYEIYRISQIISNNRYDAGDIRFIVFIEQLKNKIEGKFTNMEFETACRQYLHVNKRVIKDHMAINKCSEDQAYDAQIKQLSRRYLE